MDMNLILTLFKLIGSESIARKFKSSTYSYDLIIPNRAMKEHSKVCNLVLNILKKWKVPHHSWKKGRLILFSKTDSPFPTLGRFRPIIVNSLPLRILERFI
jgi:hypothetical protein